MAGFNIGASSSPAYDGSTLANDEDVVIVTIK
jgi:carboxylesterase type B